MAPSGANRPTKPGVLAKTNPNLRPRRISHPQFLCNPLAHIRKIIERVEPRLRRKVWTDCDIGKCQQRVIAAARRLIEGIERKAAQASGFQRLDQGHTIDRVCSADVDQYRTWFDMGE